MPDLRPGVLFDVDGTLLDTNYLHVLAWWQAFEDTGHGPVPMDRIHRAIGMPSEGLVRHLLGEDDDETVEAHSRRYEPLREHVRPLPRVRGPAARVRRPRPGRRAGDQRAGVGPGVDAARDRRRRGRRRGDDLGGRRAGQARAGPARRRHRERTASTRSATVVVGDTVWDVEAARKADLPCIGLTCGGIDAAELRDAGADAVYADPAELLEHLDDSPLGRVIVLTRTRGHMVTVRAAEPAPVQVLSPNRRSQPRAGVWTWTGRWARPGARRGALWSRPERWRPEGVPMDHADRDPRSG